MLQQTQVKTVLPYFDRFMTRFPDVQSLASADEQDVLAAWSGLGYYRRAKSLHRAARTIVHERGGEWPRDVEGWLTLPGVGRYTAGAVLSIAFGEKVPVVDGNVARVLTRLFLIGGDPRKGETARRLWKTAESILPDGPVGDFNQALMELGAVVCTPKAPACHLCPVSAECRAREAGRPEAFPEVAKRPATVPVRLAAAVVRDRSRLLLYRRDASLMEDLWELPGGECQPGEEPRAAVVREARARYGLKVRPIRELARVKHSIMNRRITLHAFEATLTGDLPEGDTPHRWVELGEIQSVPVSSMVTKVLRRLDADEH